MESEPNPVIGRRGSYAKGVARRREILDRAIEVFAERGADGTSLRRIAEAIGVSHATLLHYFDSREQLLVAVYEHAESLRTADDDPDATAVEVMVDAATRNVGVPGMVQLYSTLVATAIEEPAGESKEFFTRRFELVRAETARRLREEQSAGTVRDDIDADTLAAMLVAVSDGLQTQWLLDADIDLRDTLSLFSALLAPR